MTPSLAGPKRPQDRIPLANARSVIAAILTDGSKAPEELVGLDEASADSFPASDPIAFGRVTSSASPVDRSQPVPEQSWPSSPTEVTFPDGHIASIDNGHVVIAAITSCTNTSNPSVMIGAGLMAKKAVELGLSAKPWVKTSLAPGLPRRHRLLRQGWAHPLPQPARIRPRRLRLHDLHRQLRPAHPTG